MRLGSLLDGVPLTGGNGSQELEITSISYDSRSTRPGALFVAMPGAQTDGGRYISQAIARGCAAVLSRERPEEEGAAWFTTGDPRLALARISANWFGHPGEELCLIGITGTNGKTSTSYLIKAILEGEPGNKVGLMGTNRVLIGQRELPAQRTTPESYELQRLLREMVSAGCTHAVMEVSSHALVQHRVEGLRFRVGVFTNLSQDHLDYHHTMEAYREAKGLLWRQCSQAVLNLDDEAGRYYAQNSPCPVFSYSESRDQADLTAKDLRLTGEGVRFVAVSPGQIARVALPIPGGFSVYNALAALACGVCLEIPLERGAKALAGVEGVRGRMEPVPVEADYSVFIDYAHSPDALEKLLLTARDFTRGRLICLFGCGGDRDRGKRPLMGAIAGELADLVVLTSDNPRSEDPQAILQEILPGFSDCTTPVHIEPDRVRAIQWALEQGRAGDVILLAGKGHETYQEIRGERLPLDERDVIKSWFAAQNGREEAPELAHSRG